MQEISYRNVEITDGFWQKVQERTVTRTVPAVYDRFYATGRVSAFDFTWKEGDPFQPHIFWDSDVAKWMESAAYSLAKRPDADLQDKIERLIDAIEKNRLPDGYFNVFYEVVQPGKRFTDRTCHELYCAGHLIEAAVSYAEATGKERFLHLMEDYADLIIRLFTVEKSTAFTTPGHEEIELALFRLYRYTKKQKYYDLAKFFLEKRGTGEEPALHGDYSQSHLPIREQKEAVGHAVRAVYLYSAMADYAKESGDETLRTACETLFEDIVKRKMYVTAGIGSTPYGETFTRPYDLSNDFGYNETCASIGLIYFAQRMLELTKDSKYADVVERALYNGVLSGISLDGTKFFYENPLEINLREHFTNSFGRKRYAITQRVTEFDCSCCPPNVARLLLSLGNYFFGVEKDVLYIHQFANATVQEGDVSCTLVTDYPKTGSISVKATGVKKIAVRIPAFVKNFTCDKPYGMQNGYAVIEGTTAELTLNFGAVALFGNPAIGNDAGKVAILRGPAVYMAEGVDNGENLRALEIALPLQAEEVFEEGDLPLLKVKGYRLQDTEDLYAESEPEKRAVTLILRPYHTFANRGESDMITFFRYAKG